MEDDDIKTVGTVADSLRELLEQDDEVAFEYLTVSFLSSAITALFYARRRAGLTQVQLAERLHTKQSAIARMEADVSGSVSLRRYAEYARACGMAPLDLELEPVGDVWAFALANPTASRTGADYHAWQARAPQTTSRKRDNQIADAAPAACSSQILLEEVLESIDTIENESTRTAVLRLMAYCLTSDLPEPLLAKALDAANAIESTGLRAWTLNTLMSKLPESLKGKANEYMETALQAIARAEDPHIAMPVQHGLDRPA